MDPPKKVATETQGRSTIRRRSIIELMTPYPPHRPADTGTFRERVHDGKQAPRFEMGSNPPGGVVCRLRARRGADPDELGGRQDLQVRYPRPASARGYRRLPPRRRQQHRKVG